MEKNDKIQKKEDANTSDTSVFKLCVYYSHRSNGQTYSITEISAQEHRKYHNSIDFIASPDGWQTRHDLAFNKLVNHIKKHRDKIFTALLYANNFKTNKQFLIGKWGRTNYFDKIIIPSFTKDAKNNILINGLPCEPLETYTIKKFYLKKQA